MARCPLEARRGMSDRSGVSGANRKRLVAGRVLSAQRERAEHV